MADDRFITFARAGIMLGSEEEPLGRDFLKRLIASGDLVDNGFAHKARRISRKSVLALLQRQEEGAYVCLPEKPKSRPRVRKETAASTPTRRVAAGAGSSRSVTASAKQDDLWTTLRQ